MMQKINMSWIFICMFVLTACAEQPSALPSAPTRTPPVTAPTNTVLAFTTSTMAPMTAVAPQMTETAHIQASSVEPAAGNLPDISAGIYLDDRSTSAALMLSYFNAINRQEYLRAYSYYGSTNASGAFDEFASGYQDTLSVSVVIGPIENEGAAGSIYYTVPMVLNATMTDQSKQKYAACYIIRFPQPANFGAPPLTPMYIDKAGAENVALTMSDTDVLKQACVSFGALSGMNIETPAVEISTDVSSANYIDNRSDPVSLINSLLNAINRKEYVRAFSYWVTSPGSYSSFAAGYSDTETVTVEYGAVTSDAGAGQIYYSVPLIEHATLTNGARQTFVGCYVLHLSQPAFQATPPFQPMGIERGSFKEVDESADDGGGDLTTLLSTACQ